ncbi:MAG: TrkH family potassium uptake protein [Sedimentibacter saalensis]|jgi:trk system potassium uptake protein TrkH|uniref:Trk system potassium uptake protein TrkH n=1 Tax=Sedimentibacter saalensis TaxID=130788 RepID=A0A562J1F6_9FIRM|nr:TrkH family potassium uptake protein [Sedimentibacter saalensis]MEA5096656.1 TrkH family potassium uptake protein [Sedimentibacter saalensis]TWH76950.1 trk system potassium uptake protein TrkH [Sedimentibacter saalensis]
MKKIYNVVCGVKRNPYMVFFLGFTTIILIGAILLTLPVASQNGRSVGFVNALFTATSAVCVTGLVVVNTASHWTVFGKTIIVMLIQVGGLGVMTMTALISFFIGKRMSLKTRVFIMEERNVDELQGVVRLTKNILIFTFAIELIGAILFSFVFIRDYGIQKGIGFSVFHAVSSFCNAGFDLIGNSMINYVDNPVITLAVCGLIVIGGIGYYVFWDVYETKKFHMLTLHSKLVIVITATLLIGGTIMMFALEHNNPETMGNLSLSGKIQAAIFQAVNPRTAGFNSIPTEKIRMSTAVFTIFLMFIGGSPASTAGGIKTTTFGVLIVSFYNLVKGKRDFEVFERRITPDTTIRAAAILMISLLLVIVVSFVLAITEEATGYDFLDMLFETVSAFATVGLSKGLTPYLSDAGKLILSLVMLIGRVGPMTVAYAFLKQNKNIGNYTYPEGKVIIG